MDDKQKREKQQNTFRRIHKASINIKYFTVNVIVAISCIASVVNIFHCLRIESRTQKENEQLVLSVIVLACFLLLGVLNNFLADKILDKFLIAINRKCDNKNKQAIKKNKESERSIISDIQMQWCGNLGYFMGYLCLFYGSRVNCFF